MSLTNILLGVIAIGVSAMAVKAENAVRLLGEIAAYLRRLNEQLPTDSSLLDRRLSGLYDLLSESCTLLSKIESHTGYLTEPVKEARMKEIIDAVPRQS